MESELKISPPNSFDFPFQPYPIQHEFMENLFSVLENKKLGIFESPTGTGKSLSIICGALKWLHDRNKTNEELLKSEIEILEKKKAELESETADWLTSKSEEINVTRKINLLKLKHKSMAEYYQKFEELNSKKKQVKLKRQWKKTRNNESESVDGVNESLQENSEEIEEDALLEELIPTSREDSDDEDQKEDVYEPIKILICSRTHSQLSQLIGEIIKSPYGKKTRAITLASRQNYCINPSVNKLKIGTLINERCLDMQKKEKKSAKIVDADGKAIKRRKTESCSCPFYKQMAIDDLKDQALLEICDVEDLVGLGEQIQGCPYYASRKASEDAEVVLVPYNTLLHKATREANAIKLKNNVIIIDEAHNLLEALAQMYSSEVNLEQLELTLQQLKNYKQRFSSFFSAQNLLCINQLTFVVNKLLSFLAKNLDPKSDDIKTQIFTIQDFVLQVGIDNFNIFKLLKFSKDSRIGQKIHSYTKKNPQVFEKKEVEKKGLKQFLSNIEKSKNKPEEKNNDNDDNSKPKLNFGNPFFVFVQFLESLTYSYEDGRIIMYQNKEKKQCKFSFLLLNPAAQFKDIISEARAVVVAGGTMKPLSEFRDRLFISAGASPDRIVHFTCDHVIPKENILPLIVTKGLNNENLLFNFENRMHMGNVLKDVFCEICKKVPGGIVVFFPSYKYESWVWEQVKTLSFGRPVFREPQDSGSVDSVLESYASAIKKSGSKGALLFSVVGGKLSEGLNFSDDLGRCVVVVGLPYSNINSPELKEKMTYLDKNHGSGSGKSFYEALCTKAVNQCIGRAVRHKDDYATMILLDVRYDRPSTKASLPDWIKRSLKTCDFSQACSLIEQFFERKKKK
ncbi:ATP-dependent DNA helicase DDX11 isoform X2 [Agrilus planipennis]|uniref:ATP-dependent DNA helicase DDX11 isoform X2 n=1 Tax=Agrilus planipennis TaxID=224129 RepID=A0A7F5RGD0_AGRPL|nr:ATP-dependent DNA helicase DDX11 isoform X2 [Agrilus planipennis]